VTNVTKRHLNINKRAQKALGRSPEEKVKGHSGAIYKGPLMLSTKYWQRISRWCYTSNIKALGLVVSDKKIFESCNLKTFFWPRHLLMQPIRTIWTNFVEDHPGIIPVEFGQITISGSREDVVWSFSYIIHCKIVTPGRGQFWPRGHNLNNFGRGPLDYAIYQIWKLWAL